MALDSDIKAAVEAAYQNLTDALEDMRKKRKEEAQVQLNAALTLISTIPDTAVDGSVDVIREARDQIKAAQVRLLVTPIKKAWNLLGSLLKDPPPGEHFARRPRRKLPTGRR